MTDEDKIQELIARLSEADADKDADGFAALFTDNGAYRGKRGESRGREALRKNVFDRTRLNPPDRRTMHLFGVGIVKVDGEKATGVWPYVGYGRIGDSPWEIMSIGRFHTELVREGDGWLFIDVENRSIGSAGGPATIRHAPTV
jgi:uncharacterized protein (TIGR02246 family)